MPFYIGKQRLDGIECASPMPTAPPGLIAGRPPLASSPTGLPDGAEHRCVIDIEPFADGGEGVALGVFDGGLGDVFVGEDSVATLDAVALEELREGPTIDAGSFTEFVDRL